MPITKSFDDITEVDLLKLIDAVENESKILDYKILLRLDVEGAKDEYRRDVTSFANASGGDIIVGMNEDAEGKPLELAGFDLEKSTAENFQMRLIDLCQSKITPRIQGLRVKVIELYNGKHAAIIRIPRSLNRPHQVEIGNKGFEFWLRHDRTKQRMDVEDIRQSMVRATNAAEKMEAFRVDRLQKIAENKISVPLHNCAKLILHIIPQSAFELETKCNLEVFDNYTNERLIYPIYVRSHAEMRPNLYGMLVHDKQFGKDTCGGYVQVFHNGIIESVEVSFFCDQFAQESKPSGIDGKYFEGIIIKSIERYLRVQQIIGVETPVAITLSLHNIKDWHLEIDTSRSGFTAVRNTFMESDVYLSEQMIFDLNVSVEKATMQMFKSLWNAAGVMKPPLYNHAGNNLPANGR